MSSKSAWLSFARWCEAFSNGTIHAQVRRCHTIRLACQASQLGSFTLAETEECQCFTLVETGERQCFTLAERGERQCFTLAETEERERFTLAETGER